MTRHRFEPARLLLGLLLMGAASVYVLDALGEWRVPVWALLLLVPVALVVAALTAGAAYAVRRLLRGRRAQAPDVPGRMPMDELLGGYERSGTGGARGDEGLPPEGLRGGGRRLQGQRDDQRDGDEQPGRGGGESGTD